MFILHARCIVTKLVTKLDESCIFIFPHIIFHTFLHYCRHNLNFYVAIILLFWKSPCSQLNLSYPLSSHRHKLTVCIDQHGKKVGQPDHTYTFHSTKPTFIVTTTATMRNKQFRIPLLSRYQPSLPCFIYFPPTMAPTHLHIQFTNDPCYSLDASNVFCI